MAVGLELQAIKFPMPQEHLADFGDQRRYCAADDLGEGQRRDCFGKAATVIDGPRYKRTDLVNVQTLYQLLATGIIIIVGML